MGWDLMLEYVIALSAVASGWSSYFQSLLSGFGLHIPKALSAAPGAADGAVFNLPGALIILLITFIVSRGVKESTKLNNIIVLIKIAIVLLFIISGFAYVKPENWTPFMPMGFHGVIAGAATVFLLTLDLMQSLMHPKKLKTRKRRCQLESSVRSVFVRFYISGFHSS